ncbi:hypothetical protein [Oceanirhabdus sp. W0125-5]|uniref:hypothetical protein n=1 Tax=Oceanirhabdus sp. W0125-5 TaxID=2999116 RepID=UPI0022F33F9D|nr:hypothetical protein [Oceanirhabdus sp. W0125-5]WBW96041.1 hypothetical protein OW730_20455 [Oceanirhabdus sp. W0125-5]
MSEDNNRIIDEIPKTINYKFLKPRPDDFVDIDHINYNSDLIDKTIKINEDAITQNDMKINSVSQELKNEKFDKAGGVISGNTTVNGDIIVSKNHKIAFYDETGAPGGAAIHMLGEDLVITEPEDSNKEWARFKDDDGLYVYGNKTWTTANFNPATKANEVDMKSVKNSINTINAKIETKEDKIKVAEVENIANKGVLDAAKAQSKANTAYSLAGEGKSAAQAAQTRADQAFNKGTDAHNAANVADGKAVTAQKRADSAYALADDGKKRAVAAQVKANLADSNAVAAQTSADEAKSAADNAQRTANEAKTNAATAQSKANSGYSKAVAAQLTADTALSNASKAQTKADSAYTLATQGKNAAATAQTRADQAFNKGVAAHDAANVADGKAVTAQTTANTAKTNAATAKTRADQAYTKAESALNTANAAKSKADTVQTNLNTTNGNVSKNSSNISSLSSNKFDKSGGTIGGNTVVNGDLTIPVGKKIIFKDTSNADAAAILISGEDLIITEPEESNKEWARFKDDNGLYILGKKVWTEGNFNPSTKASTTDLNTVKSTASQAKSTADSALAKANQAFQSASEGKKSLGSALTGVGVQGIPASTQLPSKTFSWFSSMITNNTKVFKEARESGDFYVSGFGFTPKLVVAKTYYKIKRTEYRELIKPPYEPDDPRTYEEELRREDERIIQDPDIYEPITQVTYKSDYKYYVYSYYNIGSNILEFKNSGSVTSRSNSTSSAYYVTSGKMKFGNLPTLFNGLTPRGEVREEFIERYIDYTIIG